MSTVSFTISSSGSARPPGCLSHCILTCCGMRAAISLPTTAQYPCLAALSRPQEHSAHRPIHRAFIRQVPGLLARLA
jgi:hypothetical protein